MIFSSTIIDKIYKDTNLLLKNTIISKSHLIEEIKMFEFAMSQVKSHPWVGLSIEQPEIDKSSPLYRKIQDSYVGSDPEEDYKEVIVWKIAKMLYVTAAVDHDPKIHVKWDVVVFNADI